MSYTRESVDRGPMIARRPQQRTFTATLVLLVLSALLILATCSSSPQEQPASLTSQLAPAAAAPAPGNGPRLTATPNPLHSLARSAYEVSLRYDFVSAQILSND
jgi:hypothetical protein